MQVFNTNSLWFLNSEREISYYYFLNWFKPLFVFGLLFLHVSNISMVFECNSSLLQPIIIYHSNINYYCSKFVVAKVRKSALLLNNSPGGAPPCFLSWEKLRNRKWIFLQFYDIYLLHNYLCQSKLFSWVTLTEINIFYLKFYVSQKGWERYLVFNLKTFLKQI